MATPPSSSENQDMLLEDTTAEAPPGPGMNLERLTALEERIRQLEANILTSHGRLGLPTCGDSDDPNDSDGSNHYHHVDKDLENPDGKGASKSVTEQGIVVIKKMVRSSAISSYKESKPRRGSRKRQASEEKEDTAMIFTIYSKIDDKDGQGKIREKVIAELISPALVGIMRDALQATLEHGRTLSAWEKTPVTLDTSSDILTHCIDDLRMASVNDAGDDRAKRELSYFLRYLSILQPERIALRETTRKQQEVAFELLWTLFPAGCEVVAKVFQETEQIMKVQRYYEVEHKVFIVICWCYDWDGNEIVQRYHEFVVLKYDGLRPLVGLPCYPLELYSQNDKGKSETELRETLIKRGKLFRDYCVPEAAEEAPRLYRTSKILQRPDTDKESEMFNALQLTRFSEGGRKLPVEVVTAESKEGFDIVLDAARCQQYAGLASQLLGDSVDTRKETPCGCSLCDPRARQASFLKDFMARTGQAGENDALFALLPPRLHAYNILRKSWGQVHVDDIVVEELNGKRDWDQPWENLVLPDFHKENIKALVASHFTRFSKSSTKQDSSVNIQDLVRRKGDGVVILLHGVPGVGKTMTAEALAKKLRRHLLKIDASDFEHTKPAQVSEVLKRYFHLASSWGALLLLDEADVFLQNRQRTELNQNALVSILLRELEYFKGVLMMTTNRIISVDFAVQSRIHYAVRFTHFQLNGIKKVWATFRYQLNDSNCDPDERDKIDEWFKDGIRRLQDARFTGRDIRNVFIVAQLLGYPRITVANFKKAVESTTEFRRDLEKNNYRTEQQSTVSDDRN